AAGQRTDADADQHHRGDVGDALWQQRLGRQAERDGDDPAEQPTNRGFQCVHGALLRSALAKAETTPSFEAAPAMPAPTKARPMPGNPMPPMCFLPGMSTPCKACLTGGR